MRLLKLTQPTGAATTKAMKRLGGRVRKTGLICAGTITGLTGCINVAAPDEPIVIELNINIRQEVIYRLAEDAANTIDENADIF